MLNDIDRFRALADTTGVPLYNVPGDHEMQSDPVAVAILEEKGHDLWGSFDIGAYHLIALNTDEVNREGRVTGEQLEWLKEDLAASAGVQGIFVFMHRPMFSWFQGDFNPDDVEILRGSSARIRSAPSRGPQSLLLPGGPRRDLVLHRGRRGRPPVRASSAGRLRPLPDRECRSGGRRVRRRRAWASAG
jgi:hypothetical protein